MRLVCPIMKRLLASSLASLTLLSGLLAADFQPVTLPMGSPAPDFKLPGVDGRFYTLKDFASAKILVVVFTCNHCPTAQYYQDRLKQLATDYQNRGVAVVAISPNDPKSVRLDELGWTDLGDSFAEMKIRAQEKQFNFPYLYDGDTETVARAYGPLVTPHAFVFDAERKLRYVGAIDDSERIQHVKVHHVRNAIDAFDPDWQGVVPYTVLIDPDGKILYRETGSNAIKSHPNYGATDRRAAGGKQVRPRVSKQTTGGPS